MSLQNQPPLNVLAPRLRRATGGALTALALTCLAPAVAWSAGTPAAPDAPGAAPQAAVNITPAEKTIFLRDHLAGLKAPARIQYAYHRSGSVNGVAEDQVTLNVEPGEQGKAVKIDFLSGDDRMVLPAVQDLSGNPVILHFLEHEVREMHRLTGGSINYFRKRIRMALAEGPEVRAVRVKVGGREIDAQEIRIDPYRNDAMRAKLAEFVGRYYVFVFSPEVPGEVVRLTAVLNKPQAVKGAAAESSDAAKPAAAADMPPGPPGASRLTPEERKKKYAGDADGVLLTETVEYVAQGQSGA